MNKIDTAMRPDMKTEFLTPESPRYGEVQAHIHKIYHDVYGASIQSFAPLLVACYNSQGNIMCAAGIRTSADGFFSDAYLKEDLNSTVLEQTGQTVAASEIMEVVSLASATPFPVLSMLDAIIHWGRSQGMSLGIFTATAKLRHLLGRAKLSYTALCPANPAHIANPGTWGSYYDTDPWVCAFSEDFCAPVTLSPRNRAGGTEVVSGGLS
jgi:hypothetical protein